MTEDSKTRVPTVFDSTRQQVGEAWARALLGLGRERGSVDGLLQELSDFAGAIRGLPRFGAALDSPRVSPAKKQQMVTRTLEGRASQDFLNFIRVLVRRGRFDCLEAILASATKQQDEFTGRVRGLVTAAQPVDPASVQQLSRNLSQRLGREVVLQSEVDESIIGGVVVRVGDTVYDASVRNQLSRLKVRTAKKATDAIRNQLDRFASGF